MIKSCKEFIARKKELISDIYIDSPYTKRSVDLAFDIAKTLFVFGLPICYIDAYGGMNPEIVISVRYGYDVGLERIRSSVRLYVRDGVMVVLRFQVADRAPIWEDYNGRMPWQKIIDCIRGVI